MKTNKAVSKVEDVLSLAGITLEELYKEQACDNYYTKIWVKIGKNGVEKAFYEMDLNQNMYEHKNLNLVFITGKGFPVIKNIRRLKEIIQDKIYAFITYEEC